MFQNETRTVIQKAQKSPAILQELVHPPSSQAIGLFNETYAGGVYFDYLPLMHRRSDRPVALEKSFEAVALACLAREQHSRDLRRLSHESYGVALSQINGSLCMPGAVTAETLASVLLLALFVTMSGASQDARDCWSIHVHGALAMLASNVSSDLLHSTTGQFLVHHVISVVQLDCINRRVPLPPQLSSLYSASWLNHGPQAQLWSLLSCLATLNAQSTQSIGSLLHISRLQELEADIQGLLASMPQAYPDPFAFDTVTHRRPRNIIAIDIPSHVFQSHRSAQAWNTLRSMCLFTAQLLISGIDSYLDFHAIVTAELTESLRQSKERAMHNGKSAAVNICATVPVVMRPGRWVDDPDTRIRYSAWARSLMWPLSVARAGHDSNELRGYVEEQLHVVKTILGMQPKETNPSPTLDAW